MGSCIGHATGEAQTNTAESSGCPETSHHVNILFVSLNWMVSAKIYPETHGRLFFIPGSGNEVPGERSQQRGAQAGDQCHALRGIDGHSDDDNQDSGNGQVVGGREEGNGIEGPWRARGLRGLFHAQMSDDDHQINEQHDGTGRADEESEDSSRGKDGREGCEQADDPGDGHGSSGRASSRDGGKHAGGFAVAGEVAKGSGGDEKRGIETGDDGAEHDEANEDGSTGNTHDVHRKNEGRLAGSYFVPGFNTEDEKKRGNVENGDAGAGGAGDAGEIAGRIVGFGCGNGGDFAANHGEKDGGENGGERADTMGQDAAMAGKCRQRGGVSAENAAQVKDAERAEADDTDHFDEREPELEFAEDADSSEVDQDDRHDQKGSHKPDGKTDPVLEEDGAGDGFAADSDDPEAPVEPAGDKAGTGAAAFADVVDERAEAWAGDKHFAQHAHDHDNQRTCENEGKQNTGSCAGDGSAAADEETRTDDPAESDHSDVSGFELTDGIMRSAGRNGRRRTDWMHAGETSLTLFGLICCCSRLPEGRNRRNMFRNRDGFA